MKNSRILALILAVIVTIGLLPAAAAAENPTIPDIARNDIVILYTNDVHCGVGPVTDSEGNITNIGYAGVAALKKYAESLSDYVTLCDAGDAMQGDAVGTMSKGGYIADIMNAVGYDVMVPGNHEFDYGMARMQELMGMLDAEVVSANFIDLKTGDPVFSAYTMITYGQTKVAYVGITTPEAFTKSTPAYFQDADGNYIYGLSEKDNGAELYQTVQYAVDAARDSGADYVIALGHLGIEEESAPWRSTDVIAHTSGINAFIDGHSHSTIPGQSVTNKEGSEVLLTQTGTKLANIGCLTISDDGTLKTALISGYDELDADADAFVSGILDELSDDLEQVVATTKVDLIVNDPLTGQRIARSRETNLGDLVADAYRVVLGNGKQGDLAAPADIGFVNGGGIRASIAAGEVNFGQLIAVHPFNNFGCVVEATGREILDALEMASSTAPSENGGFLQVSGIEYTIDTTKASTVKTDDKGNFLSVEGVRRVKNVKVGGVPIDENKTYTVASHNYLLLSGGDGINMFRDNEIVVQPVILDNQMLITYIEEVLGGIVGSDYANPYGQGRITVLTESSFAGLCDGSLDAEEIMRYSTGTYDPEGGVTEIAAYSHVSGMAYVVNGSMGLVSAVDLGGVRTGALAESGGVNIDVKASAERDGFVYGDVTSVAVSPDGTKLAAAVQHADYDGQGRAVVWEIDTSGALTLLAVYETGVQPDMIVFADNSIILTADEGEPRNGYGNGTADPKGSVTIVSLTAGTAQTIDFTAYDAKRAQLADAGIIMKKNTAPSVDFEPEYIAVSGGKAYVTLQENNAVAVLDIAAAQFTAVYSLGVQDFAKVAVDLDNNPSAAGGAYSPRTYANTFGLRMPDGIAAYQSGGKTYIVTANEGDSRDWPGYLNEKELKLTAADGTETTKNVRVLSDDYEGQPGLADGSKHYLFGSRSFSIFEVNAAGLSLVYDSTSEFESLTAQFLPDYFNCSNDDAEADSRSNKKGPEPETVVIGDVSGKTYAFITLERIGGVMIYDISQPSNAVFVNYINSRDFESFFGGNEEGIGYNDSAEGLAFIPAELSPTGGAVLLAAFEVSGNVTAYSVGIGFNDLADLSLDVQGAVKSAAAIGLTTGIGNGKFDPDSPATMQQTVTVLLRALDIPVQYDSAMETGRAQGLIGGSEYPNQLITWGEAASLAVRALKQLKVDVPPSDGDLSLCTTLGLLPADSVNTGNKSLDRWEMVYLMIKLHELIVS